MLTNHQQVAFEQDQLVVLSMRQRRKGILERFKLELRDVAHATIVLASVSQTCRSLARTLREGREFPRFPEHLVHFCSMQLFGVDHLSRELF